MTDKTSHTSIDKQTELDLRYLRMASIWAENSYCRRRQVGALIVKDNMIIRDKNKPLKKKNLLSQNLFLIMNVLSKHL